MGVTYLGLDASRGVHVLSLIGDTDALCGMQTGGHEYTLAPSLTSPARLLIETVQGCRKCANALMPEPKTRKRVKK